MADRVQVEAFLASLEASGATQWGKAIDEAALAAFPEVFVRTDKGVVVADGSTTPVMKVFQLLTVSEHESEVIFNFLEGTGQSLAAYLRPRVLDTR